MGYFSKTTVLKQQDLDWQVLGARCNCLTISFTTLQVVFMLYYTFTLCTYITDWIG